MTKQKELDPVAGASRLILHFRSGQEVWVGATRLAFTHLTTQKLRVVIDAPPEVPIWRGELLSNATGGPITRRLARRSGRSTSRTLPAVVTRSWASSARSRRSRQRLAQQARGAASSTS